MAANFGWHYPAGVTDAMIDRQGGGDTVTRDFTCKSCDHENEGAEVWVMDSSSGRHWHAMSLSGSCEACEASNDWDEEDVDEPDEYDFEEPAGWEP